MKPRVRFAPSPTGYLHIGGARTALFNWLYARHTGGTFILRIEDTDAARNSQEAVDVILNGLRWLGLDWDEGPLTGDATGPGKGNFGPYFQSQRKENYQRRVEALLSHGLAYEHEGAVKFKMQREPITIHDLVVGDVVRKLTDREEADPDFVIQRSDGQPVFHLVNVIDDLEMDITHVIRGEDHLSNTAKHIALFQAFGVKPPHYAHIPLILNGDGTKMSKRDKGASLTSLSRRRFSARSRGELSLPARLVAQGQPRKTVARRGRRALRSAANSPAQRAVRLRETALAAGRIRPRTWRRPVLRTRRPRLRQGRA